MQAQVANIRDAVIPLAEYDTFIGGVVEEGRGLAEHLAATTARAQGDAAAAGAALIRAAATLGAIAEQVREDGVSNGNELAVASNVVSVAAYFLIDGAQTAQDAEAGR